MKYDILNVKSGYNLSRVSQLHRLPTKRKFLRFSTREDSVMENAFIKYILQSLMHCRHESGDAEGKNFTLCPFCCGGAANIEKIFLNCKFKFTPHRSFAVTLIYGGGARLHYACRRCVRPHGQTIANVRFVRMVSCLASMTVQP